MAPKIFLTGATGYIGGEALYSISQAHPDADLTLLVRSEDKAKLVSAQYPSAKFVYGGLDDSEALEKAAAEADIVVHTADSSDHVPAAKAIAKGLAEGHSAEKPGYWIHVCGTGILQWYDWDNNRYGQSPLPEEKYHDIDDIDRITSLPHHVYHRDVDEIVLAANDTKVKTLIVGPPTIYGPGRGPVNQRSIQAYNMAKFTLENGFAPIMAGEGSPEWDYVHIQDLGNFFALAVSAALDPEKANNPEIFGPHGYFFLENGTFSWRWLATRIAEEAHKQGFIPEAKTQEGDYKNYGANSKSVAARAKKYLGWEAHGTKLEDEIPNIVASEAKRLGK
ncbi:nucleoside-diphosphate-sugar epimerase [Xylaria bambusicola]|uniref:nucleoside-diphosphate-sugar epimerase n=1 Tax=Xylaria bambusicola TaxID=326684 RepID=UPI002007CF2E|nr:nucleoside-diphosphate-sugar epimerase [Xylaria bambusicola]KAI0525657.1 nucleoside-diphosphate-sugar epimerase [Xylaria bambusicola]